MSDADATPRAPSLAAPLAVAVDMPADPAWLHVARGFAGTAGVALDFDIDTIADLRMAVDEMVTILITRAAEQRVVHLALLAGGDRIEVSGRVVVAGADPVDQGSFGWMVLTTLTRELSATIDPATGILDIRLTVVADRGGS